MPLDAPCRRVGFLCWALFAVIAAAPASSEAQLTESERERLVDEIERAGERLDAERLPELAPVQQEVLANIEAAREYFRGAADPENFDAWMDYLDLQTLEEAIEADQSPRVQGRAAVELQQRLTGVAPGLELPALRSLRESVGRLIAAIRFRDPDQALAGIADQLESLAERIGELPRVPSTEDAAAISTLIGTLQHSGQASGAIDSLRQVFSRPNVVLWASERLVRRVGHREVNQTRQIRDCILGTRLVGCASLRGAVTTDLLPSRGTARLQLTLAADFSSTNTGRNGPVRLKTSGVGHVTATRTLQFDESGLRADEGAFVRASLDSQINSIAHHLRLVRKIAWKQARRQKPQADRIAVEKLRRRVGEQFVAQTDEATAVSPPDFMLRARPWFQRLDLPQPSPYWGSTDEALFIEAVLRPSGQLATVVSPPPVTAASYDAAIQIHESAIHNALAQMLAGRTVNESQLTNLLESVDRGPTASGDREAESQPPFELDFARFRPVIFEVRDQAVRLGIRGTRFQQDGRTLNRPLEITVLYRPERSSEGIMSLVRDEQVDVDFPGGGRSSLTQTALRSSIRELFDDLFPQSLLDRSFNIPADAEIEPLRGHRFRPHQIDARRGWLTVAIR